MRVQVTVLVLAAWSTVLADSSVAQSRLFFPVLSVFGSNGYSNGYPAPSKASYYPPARPSKGQYPAPRPPSSAYGAPKPSYPAPAANYPPPKAAYGAPKPSYPAPSPSYPAPKPSYGAPKPVSTTYKPPVDYHASTTRAPVYFTTETAVSYPTPPKPGYQPQDQQWSPGPVFVFIPKPQNSRPPAYPAASYPEQTAQNPSYPSPSYQDPKPSYLPPPSQPSYPKPSYPAPNYPKPSYPAPAPTYSQPSYPAPAPSYPKPSYPAPAPTYSQPSYPAPAPSYSQPSYPAPAPSYPKPSYPAPAPSYPKPSYPAPAPSYPKPSYPALVPSYSKPSYPKPSYGAPKPNYPAPAPSYPHPPVYADPYPGKQPAQYPTPVKPYEPAKPSEGAYPPVYEVPRPIAPPPEQHYRTGSTQSPAAYEEPLTASSGHNGSGVQVPSYVVGVLPDYQPVNPQVFQRGNGQHQHFHSTGTDASTSTEGSRVQTTLFRQQVESVTPRSVWWPSGGKHNDCGGPWVILGDASDSYDPSQIQVGPVEAQVPPQRGRDQSGRAPSAVALPAAPQLNELAGPPVHRPLLFTGLKETESEEPSADQFFFLASPTTSSVSSSSVSSSTASGADEGSSVAFKALPILPASSIASASNQSISSGSLFIDSVNGPNTPTIKVLSSTENSVVFSRDNRPDEESSVPQLVDVIGTNENGPSPFLVAASVDSTTREVAVAVSQASDDQESDKSGRNVHLSDGKSDPHPDNSLASADWEVGNYTSVVTSWLARANLKALAYWMELAEVASLLQPDQEYTLMAPSNVAFSQVSSGDRRRWRDRQDQLRHALLYHIVPGRLSASSLVNEDRPSTLAGSQRRLRINVYNGTDNQRTLTVDGARVLTPDLQVDPSGWLTVHVVDLVLDPVPQDTILDILEQGGLHSAILGPTLSSTLASATALTVFVPVTEAFLQIGQDDQLSLLHNDTAFHRLLWYHVVPGTHYSQGMEDGQELTSLRDIGKLKLRVERRGRRKSLLEVNGARVVRSDVSATNGVIHFIDRILTSILL